jgi:dipeptidyl-peptidase-4
MDGKLQKRLTSGDWTVSRILAVDEEENKIYFTGDKEKSTGTGLYVVGLNGRGFKTILPANGIHSPDISPGFDYVLDSWSDHRTPRQVNLHAIDGKRMRQLADSANPEIDAYHLAKVEMFTIPAADGTPLPAWWIIPSDLDTSGETQYGVIFRIYSGPGSSTVRDSYRWSWRDHWYAANGVITISVDHRGSGHFGKAGIAKMYRSLGIIEVEDLSKAVDWLREKPFIDSARIGITGHSYGGYITLLALAKAPDHFTHGISGAPVTDWRLYDTVYTERYMDHPRDNPEGYKEGNVMAFAHQIKGELRLLHGTIDDNVHMQNSIQMVDALIDNGVHFEFMVYPGSRHGIRQRQHWSDSENTFWFRHFLDKPFKKN